MANKRTKMKILNLYACLGGNRYKWNEVKEDIEVTAVELDIECARLYTKASLVANKATVPPDQKTLDTRRRT